MAKKSKALRELEAMEEDEKAKFKASKARLEAIWELKQRMAEVTKPKTRRTSVRPKLTSMAQTIETDANGSSA